MRSRLSYANVVSSVALFIALGGTSYAVIKLPRNSVGSREVRNRSLKAVDLANGVVRKSVRGPRGPAGPAGLRGPSDVVTAHRANVTLPAGAGAAADVVTLNVPAGSWWFLGSASIVNNAPGTTTGDPFRCGLTYAGAPGDVGSVAVLGIGPSTTAAGALLVHEARALPSPTPIRLRCSHDSATRLPCEHRVRAAHRDQDRQPPDPARLSGGATAGLARPPIGVAARHLRADTAVPHPPQRA